MYREKVVIRNLQSSFPDWSEEQRQDLKRKIYRHLKDVVVETLWGLVAPYSWMDRHITFDEGLKDMLADAKAHGGCMFMLGHMGCWEWIADYSRRIAPLGFLQANVYRRQRNRLADRIIHYIRERRGGTLIEKDSLIREMVRLRKGPMIPCYGMLADQHPSPRSAQVWTRFLNQDTAFLTGSELLAKRFGYPCYYVHVSSPRRHYYHIRTIKMTGEGYEGECPITQEYAARLEQNILEQPELWLWTHNRWKWKKQA